MPKWYIITTEVIDMPIIRQNITVDKTVFEKFCLIAGRKGIKISTWITMKMREFVEDKEALAELKKNRSK